MCRSRILYHIVSRQTLSAGLRKHKMGKMNETRTSEGSLRTKGFVDYQLVNLERVSAKWFAARRIVSYATYAMLNNIVCK